MVLKNFVSREALSTMCLSMCICVCVDVGMCVPTHIISLAC